MIVPLYENSCGAQYKLASNGLVYQVNYDHLRRHSGYNGW
jgi:hypothetical protein